MSNQIDVMSKAFLGVTAACARCHDHKFDAISAEDYAALSGLLRSSRRAVGFLDPNETISQVAGKLELVRQQEHEMADGCFVVKPVSKPKPESLRCSLIASPMNHCGSTMVWRSAPPPPMHPARSADASSGGVLHAGLRTNFREASGRDPIARVPIDPAPHLGACARDRNHPANGRRVLDERTQCLAVLGPPPEHRFRSVAIHTLPQRTHPRPPGLD